MTAILRSWWPCWLLYRISCSTWVNYLFNSNIHAPVNQHVKICWQINKFHAVIQYWITQLLHNNGEAFEPFAIMSVQQIIMLKPYSLISSNLLICVCKTLQIHKYNSLYAPQIFIASLSASFWVMWPIKCNNNTFDNFHYWL